MTARMDERGASFLISTKLELRESRLISAQVGRCSDRSLIFIFKPRVFLQEDELNVADRTVALFANQDFGETAIFFRWARILLHGR